MDNEKRQKKKKKRIKIEKERLLKIFEDVEENKKDFVKNQIVNLAWYNVSIEDLQESIDEYGTIVTYNNGGGQTGIKDNPDVKTLIAYQKHVNTIVNQLVDLVPQSQKKSKLMELMNE